MIHKPYCQKEGVFFAQEWKTWAGCGSVGSGGRALIKELEVRIPAPSVHISKRHWAKTLNPELFPMGLVAPCTAAPPTGVLIDIALFEALKALYIEPIIHSH